MKSLTGFGLLMAAYIALLGPLSREMASRQSLVKLGYVPDARIVGMVAVDQKLTVAAFYSMKAIIYYGDMIQQWRSGFRQRPEFDNLLAVLQSSVQLDPYNMDNYYFAQASFTWGVNRASEVNRLLDYGMDFRDWDWLLPYYAGFNAGYFLDDKAAAAQYMRRAAKLTGNPLLTQLTARYLQGAGRTALGVVFLDEMIAGTRDMKIVEQLQVRRQALLATLEIEKAVDRYNQLFDRKPTDLEDLTVAGLLPVVPRDPYGGRFYLDDNSAVHTTSNMVFSREDDNK